MFLSTFLLPRLSIPNMEDLKRRILKIVSNCSKPKVRTILCLCDMWALVVAPPWGGYLCCSTASCCGGVGMSCLEEIRTTSPPRWTVGGSTSSAGRCWGRSRSSFAPRRPIRAWHRTTPPPTQPQTCRSSCQGASCTSQRTDRRGGRSFSAS